MLTEDKLRTLKDFLARWEARKSDYLQNYDRMDPKVLFGLVDALKIYQTGLQKLARAAHDYIQPETATLCQETEEDWKKALALANQLVGVIPTESRPPGPLVVGTPNHLGK